jgi:hypothetical protein
MGMEDMMKTPPDVPEDEQWITGEKAVELVMLMYDVSREDAEEMVRRFMLEHFDDIRWTNLH